MVDSPKTGSKELGELLRRARERRGMSRNDLVEASGLSYPYVSQLETAYRMPSPAAIRKLADALGISLDDIFAAMSKPSPEPLSVRKRVDDAGWIPNEAYSRPAEMSAIGSGRGRGITLGAGPTNTGSGRGRWIRGRRRPVRSYYVHRREDRSPVQRGPPYRAPRRLGESPGAGGGVGDRRGSAPWSFIALTGRARPCSAFSRHSGCTRHRDFRRGCRRRGRRRWICYLATNLAWAWCRQP